MKQKKKLFALSLVLILILAPACRGNALFEVKVELLQDSFFPESNLKGMVTVINLDKSARTELSYMIMTAEGNIIYEEKESLPIEHRITFLKIIPLPKNLELGEYVFLIELQNGESVQKKFQVGYSLSIEKAPFMSKPQQIYIITFILLVSGIWIIRQTYKKYHKPKIKKKKAREHPNIINFNHLKQIDTKK